MADFGSLWLVMGHIGSFWFILAHYRSFWLIPFLVYIQPLLIVFPFLIFGRNIGNMMYIGSYTKSWWEDRVAKLLKEDIKSIKAKLL